MAYKNVVPTNDIDLINDNQYDDKQKFLRLVEIAIEHMDEWSGDVFESGYIQGRGVRIVRNQHRTVSVHFFINPQLEEKE